MSVCRQVSSSVAYALKFAVAKMLLLIRSGRSEHAAAHEAIRSRGWTMNRSSPCTSGPSTSLYTPASDELLTREGVRTRNKSND